STVTLLHRSTCFFLFFFHAEDGIRDFHVTGVQTCALPIYRSGPAFGLSDGGGISSPLPMAFGGRWSPVSRRARWTASAGDRAARSEERRVGKECRSGRGPARRMKQEDRTSLQEAEGMPSRQ